MKKCSQCLLEKEDINFYEKKNQCKACYLKLWRKNNPSKARDSWKKYYEAHREREKQRSKRNHEKNKEYNLERQRNYYRKRYMLKKQLKTAELPTHEAL